MTADLFPHDLFSELFSAKVLHFASVAGIWLDEDDGGIR
jgi:hypothetical protein